MKITINISEILKSIRLKTPKTIPRKGWDKAFKKMRENGDNKLLIPDVFEGESIIQETYVD